MLLQKLQEHLKLTWIYDQTSAQIAVEQTIELSAMTLSLKQATDLLELSRRGDIEGIVAFAKRYNITEIRRIAKHYMENVG